MVPRFRPSAQEHRHAGLQTDRLRRRRAPARRLRDVAFGSAPGGGPVVRPAAADPGSCAAAWPRLRRSPLRGCHTIGLDDGGAREGPAFYKLARRYNALQLERRFAEVAQHGFDRMPSVPFTRSEAEDLVAYFDSLHGN